jgi:hypothetical protein
MKKLIAIVNGIQQDDYPLKYTLTPQQLLLVCKRYHAALNRPILECDDIVIRPTTARALANGGIITLDDLFGYTKTELLRTDIKIGRASTKDIEQIFTDYGFEFDR